MTESIERYLAWVRTHDSVLLQLTLAVYLPGAALAAICFPLVYLIVKALS